MNYEVMGEALFNALLILLTGLICLQAYRSFFSGSKILSIRFRLFSLRDELGMLAVMNQIDESTPEYRHLHNLINDAIGSCESLDFHFFVNAISKNLAPDTISEHEAIISKINNKPELVRIYGQALMLILESFDHNSAIISYLIKNMKWLRSSEVTLARSSRKTAETRLKDVTGIMPTAAAYS